MENFKQVEPKTVRDNIFKLIGGDWMLVTSGEKDNFNTMTASWGAMGVLWNKEIAISFIRPQRYTYKFANKYDIFTLSFFDEKYKEALKYCGSHSGRDVNKIAIAGLNPIFNESGGIYFNEAKLVMICKNIYFDDIKPENILDRSIFNIYPKKDYHRMFIGEIKHCLVKNNI